MGAAHSGAFLATGSCRGRADVCRRWVALLPAGLRTSPQDGIRGAGCFGVHCHRSATGTATPEQLPKRTFKPAWLLVKAELVIELVMMIWLCTNVFWMTSGFGDSIHA